ncbi:RloB family protein [Vibrio metoecus]|uniref:RloB family protein n=1 Tax=Vibrio metoecus TaxID=1481663 RepID=UPI000BA9D0CA|nr:RloB family protein [Vibrio metoecus]PAR32261.1 hypothetical protein CGT99_08925 [Vibrio metoecus]
MGSDDIFHKLKQKAKKEKKREVGKKEPYPKFLIVCEDTVSGYHYLIEAVKYYRLSSANFCIVGLGQDPLKIVQDAENRYNTEVISYRPDFDQVFCVFDRDTHAHYYNAISKIESINNKLAKPKPVFIAITSNPCFEIWLILHFAYTTKSYAANQTKTAANQVVNDLVNHLSNYKKNSSTVFNETVNLLTTAIDNAQKLDEYCENNLTDVPHTKMGELMTFISTLKQ